MVVTFVVEKESWKDTKKQQQRGKTIVRFEILGLGCGLFGFALACVFL